jgi:phosphatidylglycerophosphatase A
MSLFVDNPSSSGPGAGPRSRPFPVLVAAAGGIGFIPFAPGTFGSIPGVALALLLRAVAPWWAEGAALVVLFAIGVWAARASEAYFGKIDPGPVVIDEVVGMLITTLFLPLSWIGWVVGFVVFRACDVIKPFPAGRAERLPGGWGVMCDDVLAGVWGYAIMRGLLWAFPQWLGA